MNPLCTSVLLALLIFSWPVIAIPMINEIMYNPEGDDNNREFVEIYDAEIQNVSGYIISDASSNDTLRQTQFINGSEYALIVEDGFNYSSINASIYTIGSTIGNNLNDNDTLWFYNSNGTLLDTVSYDSSLGAKNNNRSLERRKDGTWGESRVDGGTPGYRNSLFNVIADYADIELSEILPDPYDADDALKPFGEWVELHNFGREEVYMGGTYLEDDDGNKLMLADPTVPGPYGLFIPPGGYMMVYRDGNRRFTLNNDGFEIIYLNSPSGEIIEEVAYASSVEGMSWSKIEGDWYLTKPTPEEPNELTTRCDWFLTLDLQNSIYQGRDLNFTIGIERFYGLIQNITVYGQIEDMNGEVIRTYNPWSNTEMLSWARKTYSPNLPEGLYQISFWIGNLTCIEDNISIRDNYISRIFVINPEYKQNLSTLSIESADDSTRWGDQLTTKLLIHKGDEQQSTVRLWAEKENERISSVTPLSLRDPFTSYTLTIPLQLYPNCDNKYDDGTAIIVLEGFNQRVTKITSIKGYNSKLCASPERQDAESRSSGSNSPLLSLLDTPSTVSPGSVLPLQLQILNDANSHSYTIWAYAYRGNKCYSCLNSSVERNHNRKTLNVAKNEVKITPIFLKLDDTLAEGEYKLKVSIIKDNQKTPKELVESVYVLANKTTSTSISTFSTGVEGNSNQNPNARKLPAPQSRPLVIYESNTAQSEKLIPLFLAVAFGALCLVLLRKQ